MKIIVLIARILMGLIFVVFGLNGFLHFIPAPPSSSFSGNMLTFVSVLLASHFYVLVFGVQIIAGFLLVINRYVPLALVALAAVLANILTFHITMQPQGLPVPIFVTILWFIVAFSVRPFLMPLLVQKT